MYTKNLGEISLTVHYSFSLFVIPFTGSWYRDGHPRGQAVTTACCHEGGSYARDLPRPDRGIRCIGQVTEPGDPERLRSGRTVMEATDSILGTDDDGGKGGELLREGV